MAITVIKWKKMVPIPQADTAKCWLAAYQMMFTWKGKDTSQLDSLLRKAIGSTNTDDAYKKGLDRPDWPKAATGFGLTSIAGGDYSLSDITGYLSHGPLLVHGKFPLGMHSIVVFGTDDGVDQVGYVNPYWSQDPSEVKTRWSPFSWLKGGISSNKPFNGTIQHW